MMNIDPRTVAREAEAEIDSMIQSYRAAGATEDELAAYKERVIKRAVEIMKTTIKRVTGHEFGGAEMTQAQFEECLQVMAGYWEPIIAEQHAQNGTQPAPKTDRIAPTEPTKNYFGIRPQPRLH
ncbi:hypothetical protein NRB36_004318 [Salmonella enterica]|nr:hypothetical protein [Salmonella enterica]EJO1639677.1 hypothetical protein [Salmonella enterica]